MRSGERILYENRRFTVGEFHCPPGDHRWSDVNIIGSLPYVVYPGTSVVIKQQGHESILANANHVVFYRRDQRFRRLLHDPRGDHCVFIRVEAKLVAELLEAAGVAARHDDLPFVQGPSDPHAHLALQVAAHALRRGSIESLAIEEAVYDALRRSIERGAALHLRRRLPVRRRTEREHNTLVEEAKAILTERAAVNDSLESLARQLHVSEFHLCRVFRDRTGFTLHRYRTHLRLRLALERFTDFDVTLGAIAAEVGLTSRSHFADVFRAVFGVTPSEVRGTLSRRSLLDVRTIAEASLTARL
jgi:AraC family transcriptional regulator